MKKLLAIAALTTISFLANAGLVDLTVDLPVNTITSKKIEECKKNPNQPGCPGTQILG